MDIAIIAPGNLPVPATDGGAVESLIDSFLQIENKKGSNIVDVYSVSEHIHDITESKQGRITYIQMPFARPQKVSPIMRKFRPQVDFTPFIRFVCKFLDQKKYDVIVIENRATFVYDIAKHANGAKMFLHLHNENFVYTKYYCRKVPKYCTNIITVSNYIKSVVNKQIQADNAVVLYNGIDITRFKRTTDPEQIKQIKDRYGISEDSFVLCYTGRVCKEKGVLELIEAFSKLNDLSNICLLIIGSSWFGTNQVDEYILKVQQKSKECKNPIIFTGYVDNSEVAKIESISDVAVLPSVWNDPLPLTVIEAMASGLPVITTLMGGIPEMCTSETGILLRNDAELSDSISNAIKKLLLEGELRKKMGDNGRKRVEELFTLEKYYDNFINIISR